ncbi:MAG: hypothetical protein IK007_08060 [Lachnospiraceae bacterium]|nr:hypothetical protein [Lachnospiraceae bacterium]
MIDTIENTIFLSILLVCVIIDFIRAVKTKKREWMLLFLFHVLYFISSIYYEMYILFFESDPVISHIMDIGWYASYLFLTLLLQNNRDPEMDGKKYKSLILIPIFVFSMAAGFMWYSQGDVFNNILCAVLMWILLRYTVKGALFNKEKYGKNYPAKWLYRSSFIFCYLEYQTWVFSCIFFEDSWTNPYYISDMLMALSFLLFIPSVSVLLKNIDNKNVPAQSDHRSEERSEA